MNENIFFIIIIFFFGKKLFDVNNEIESFNCPHNSAASFLYERIFLSLQLSFSKYEKGQNYHIRAHN